MNLNSLIPFFLPPDEPAFPLPARVSHFFTLIHPRKKGPGRQAKRCGKRKQNPAGTKLARMANSRCMTIKHGARKIKI